MFFHRVLLSYMLKKKKINFHRQWGKLLTNLQNCGRKDLRLRFLNFKFDLRLNRNFSRSSPSVTQNASLN